MDPQEFRIMLDWHKEKVWTRKHIQKGFWITGKKVNPWGRPNPQGLNDKSEWICYKFEMAFK